MPKDSNSTAGPVASKSSSPSPAGKVGDGFLSTLADLESRLTTLKSLHEQSESVQQELDGREKALEAREADFTSRFSMMERRQGELEKSVEQLRIARGEVEDLKRTVEAAQAESRNISDARQNDLDRRAAEITETEKTLHFDRQELEARQAESLKESQDREAAVRQREQEIAARQVKAESSAAEARREREQAEAERKNIAAQQAQVEQRVRQLAEQEQALVAEKKQAEQDLEIRDRALRALENELGEREIDIKSHAAELQRERAGAVEHARTLAEQMKSGEDEAAAAIWSNRMESIQLQLGESNAARAKFETELSQARQDIESLTQELLDATQNRGVPPEEVARREKQVASLTAQLEESRATLQMLQAQIDQTGAGARNAEAAREQVNAELAALKHKHEQETSELRVQVEAAQRSTHQAAERLAQAERDAKAATDLLAESERKTPEAMQRAARAEEEARDLEKSLGDLREKMNKTVEDAAARVSPEDMRRRDEEIESLRKQISETLSHSGDAGAVAAQAIAAKDREIAELRRKVAEARSAEVVDPAQIAERDRTIAQLREEIEHGRSQPAAAGDAAAQEELLKREQAVVLLKERLEQVMAERSELAERVEKLEQPEDLAPSDDDGPSEADFRRRDRLRRYKVMLQTQARKILAAQTALQRRHTECETVLAQRAKLASMAQELARSEKKVTGGKARNGAAAAMLYMVATLSVLAVMSWEVSKRVWPGTYIAKTVLEADTGRRSPSADDLSAWQKDHEDLIKDPRLLEVAAERMGRRGLASYSTAIDLKTKLDKDMYVQSSRPGQMTVELRGEGADRTALILDTYVTALKSVADQMRDERTNDIGVTIAQAAASGAEPLLDKRIEKAGSVFGGAALAAGLAGLVIWSRLVRAKRKFDHAQAVEAALNEVDWNTLEASLKKSGAERKGGDVEHG